MGKCVSKHPSSLTLAATVSERDLAAANRIWSKFAESSEYIALRDEHGNQLCEYRCVSTSTGGLKGDEGRTEQHHQQHNHQEEQQNEPLHHHGSLTVHGSSIPGHGSPIPVHGSSIPGHVALRKNESRAKKNKTEEESKDDVNDSDGAVVDGDHHHHRYCDGVGRVVAVVEGNANDWEATKAMATTATPTIWLDELVVVGVDGEVTGRARTREERANEEEMREGVREGTSERAIERSSPPALDSKLDSESMEKKAMAQWDNRTHNNNQTTSTNNNQTTSTNDNHNNAGHNVGNIVNRSHNNNNSNNTMTDLSQLWLLRGHQQQQQQHILNDDDDNNNNNNNNIDGDANNNEMVSSRNSKNKNEENKNNNTDSFSGKQRMINCKQRAKAEKSEKSNFKNKHYGKHILDTDDDNEIDLENNGRHRHRDDDHGTKLNDESNDHDDDDDDDDGLQRCFSFRSGTSRKEGQSESKKLKKHGVIGSGGAGGGAMETKGTAMSFGFRKKHNTTPKKSKKQKETTDGSNSSNKKKHDNKWDAETGGDGSQGAVIDTAANDKNGNTEQMLQQVHFEKVGAAVAAKSHHGQGVPSTIGELQQQQQQQQSNRPGAGNRFGFKGTSIVRPASTGFTSSTSRLQSDELYQVHANVENNNCGNGNNNNSSSNNNIGDTATGGTSGGGLPYKSNLKRRSKSAHSARSMTSNQCDPEFGDGDGADGADRQMAGTKITQPKTITFNLNHNTIEYQRRQFFQQTPPATSTASAIGGRAPYNVVNTGLHTNLIVRPTPRAAAATAAPFTKFTLQTTSLPKPEYPVPIRVGTTPTSAGPPTILQLSTGARAKEAAAAHAHTNAQSNAQMHSQAQGHSQAEGHSTAQGLANAPGHSHSHMDQKTAKQMANSTRRGFNGSREISADSGIASLDIALAGVDTSSSSASSGGGSGSGRHASPKRSRSRPRNLQMVMSGRHKFEVRDLDDPLSSESSSVEPLALPKLPAENQTAPLPLSGLVRSNTVLSREAFLKSGTAGSRATSKTRDECDTIALSAQPAAITVMRAQVLKQPSEESDSVEEEKLHIDSSTSEKNAKHLQKFRDINMYSSKTSSGGSSLASATTSWCNAGESLAAKDCSSLSLSRSSSEDSNKLEAEEEKQRRRHSKDDDDLSTMLTTDMQISSISSMTESLPAALVLPEAEPRTRPKELPPVKTEFLASSSGGGAPADNNNGRHERPQSLCGSSMDESKFAEMAAAGSEFLLDDETSPTDSLVSSTDSDDAGGVGKQQKRRANEEIQEKDLDEISPELEEVGSPISPGTPTHASHSLSLSDCGNLIDDEIADQPALLFNNESGGDGGGVDSIGTASASHKGAGRSAETPTLMETGSMRSLKSQSKARTALQQAIELSLRTPISVRKAVMRRAESLDTLSPCESICSDDLMMDFDMTSSMDSIDKSMSIKSRSGSDLNKLDETMLFSDLERKGSDVMKELNTILRVHTRNPDKESVIAQLPARATRLLNRSRLQQQCQLSNADSESPKSNHSQRRSNASRGSSSSQHHHHQYHHHSGRDTNSSSDDLMLYDKSFRNAMIQDVLQFKKQLLRLRRILQEDEDLLMRTETLNPFETDNGQIFASCGLDSKLLDDIDLASLTSSTTDDPLQELADLRRQVVYLQGQVDDRDRTIRLQRNLIEKLEAEKGKPLVVRPEGEKECINMATQTERTRPISIGPDGLSRSKPEYTSYTTYFPVLSSDGTTIIHQQQQQQHPQSATSANQTRRHTIISTTFTNYNHQPMLAQAPRRASIAWESQTTPPPTAAVAAATTATAPAAAAPTTATYKPVKITLIGEPMKQEPPRSNGEAAKHNNNNNHSHNNSPSTNGCNGSHQHVAATAAVDGDKRRNGTSGELSVERNGLHRNGHHSHPAEVTNTTTNGTQQHGFYQQQHQQLQQQQQLYDKYQQHKLSYNNMKHIGNSNNTTTTTTKNRCGSQQPVVTIV